MSSSWAFLRWARFGVDWITKSEKSVRWFITLGSLEFMIIFHGIDNLRENCTIHFSRETNQKNITDFSPLSFHKHKSLLLYLHHHSQNFCIIPFTYLLWLCRIPFHRNSLASVKGKDGNNFYLDVTTTVAIEEGNSSNTKLCLSVIKRETLIGTHIIYVRPCFRQIILRWKRFYVLANLWLNSWDQISMRFLWL